jgi:hypothetical protein
MVGRRIPSAFHTQLCAHPRAPLGSSWWVLQSLGGSEARRKEARKALSGLNSLYGAPTLQHENKVAGLSWGRV